MLKFITFCAAMMLLSATSNTAPSLYDNILH